jgi:hypothetical protein
MKKKNGSNEIWPLRSRLPLQLLATRASIGQRPLHLFTVSLLSSENKKVCSLAAAPNFEVRLENQGWKLVKKREKNYGVNCFPT